jgi:hypothetical protein
MPRRAPRGMKIPELCSIEYQKCARADVCFNPFQGICPAAALSPQCRPHPTCSFNPFQGICPAAANERHLDRHHILLFQSLPGNLPCCGRLPLQHCIFRLIARVAQASPPKVSKSHRSIGGMSVSYPIKLWHVNRFFISERPRNIS